MPVLAAALVVVGVIAVVDLVLTFAVLRRLRDHNDAISRLQTFAPGFSLPVGTKVPDFEARTLDGAVVSAQALRGADSLVAFFSARCDACRDHLPQFRELAIAMRASGRVLAVVAQDEVPGDDLIEALRDVADVAVEPEQGPLAQAFSVGGFPMFFGLDARGRVTASTPDVSELPVPEPLSA
jgi:peroxiredoxin